MNNRLLLIVISLVCFYGVSIGQSEALIISGGIGKYPIDMKITKSDREKGTFEGVYNYSGHKNTLTIKGEIYGDCILIEESFKGKNTGQFYLQRSDLELKGKWIDSTRWYSVDLKIESGDRSLLDAQSIKDKSENTSKEITGTYEVENYFLNDMWFREEHPNMEIGYNGGYIVLQEHNADSLSFAFEVICGPTYHFAIGNGVAYKSGDVYVSQFYEECLLEIKVGERSVTATASGSSIDCGFGARAYLDHTFTKTSDDVEMLDKEH